MRGGNIDYAPLPCDANGVTDWNSTAQVGHESCVKYGTEGAENDAKFSGQKMSAMDIDQTIKDAVDAALGEKASAMGQNREYNQYKTEPTQQ